MECKTRYLIEFSTRHEWYTDTIDDAVKDAKTLELEHYNVAVFEIEERTGPDQKIERQSSKPIDYKLLQ